MKFWQFLPLRNKLIISFLAVAIIPLLLLAFINYQTTQKILIENANQALIAVARQTAISIDNLITDSLNSVKVEATLPGITRYLVLPANQRLKTPAESFAYDAIKSLSRKDPINIISYAILDLKGQNLMDTYSPNIGKNESQQDYFQIPLNTGLPYVSPLRLSARLLGEAIVYFSAPIRNSQGQILGILRLCYHAQIIQKLATRQVTLADHNYFAILLDENYIRLADGKKPSLNFTSIVPLPEDKVKQLQQEKRLPNLPATQLSTYSEDLKKALDKTTFKPYFTTSLPELNYQLATVAVARLSSQPWLILLAAPRSAFIAPIKAQTRDTLLLSLLIASLVTLVAVLIARNLAKPIIVLTNKVSQFNAGNLEVYVPVKGGDEIAKLAVSFNQMINRIKDYTSNLEQKNWELQRLDRLKDEFLANTSHELRTPLHGIIGIAESLIDGATGQLSSETQTNLAMIVASGKRLANLVNDILDFAKMQNQSLQMQMKPVWLYEIVEIIITINQTLIKQKNISLINRVSPDLPPVFADENRVQQIFYNLVGNAIKFTDTGTIEITAQILENHRHPHSTMLALTVADTGIGISPDKFTEIFTDFLQIDGTTDRAYSGTGLGLAITKKLVELQGGEIWVESTLNQGSQFTFTLPIFTGEIPTNTPVNLKYLPPPLVIPNREFINEPILPVLEHKDQINKNYEILIVDDEPVNLQVLVNYLSLQNYLIRQATNGQEVLDLLASGYQPHLILLDVMMPRLNGYEVTRQIRQRWPAHELPIVLLTAKNQIADLVVGLEAGANDYLTKPIAKDELLARVRNHLLIQQLKIQAMEVSQSSEKLLRQFLEAMPVAVFITDTNGNAYFANQKAIELLGQGLVCPTNKEQIAEVYHTYLAGTDEFYPEHKNVILRALKGETSMIDDAEIKHGNRRIPIEVIGTPIFNENGEVIYAIATFQDITERKESETEKQMLIEDLFTANCDLELALEMEQRLVAAASRFVPNEFLSFLGYETIADVKLGDAVQQEMSILFSDIRNFTTISETMTPEDNFRFINSYLKRMEPAIVSHHGFIDKYIGDAIMALFGGYADEAVQAGITMLEYLKDFNRERQAEGFTPIKIGIGINSGNLMLGTVGGDSRIDTTVISDAVNLASRVETLTKHYGVALLITHHTFTRLTNPSSYAIRLIDQVQVKGKSELVTVYEVFEADHPELKAGKLACLDKFAEAIANYNNQNFREAAQLFKCCLEQNGGDRVAQIYLGRCQKLMP